MPGDVLGVDIDTRWFTGNNVPSCSIQAAEIEGDDWVPGVVERLARGGGEQGTAASPEQIAACEAACEAAGPWFDLVPKIPLAAGYEETSLTRFEPDDDFPLKRITHIRFNYFPDGGVARLRLWGQVAYTYEKAIVAGQPMDLAAMAHGGIGVACSNKHYGVPRNLLQPGRGVDMGDGWETARHPSRPGIVAVDPATGLSASSLGDWAVLRLGARTLRVDELVVDTHHFKGNFPESVFVEGSSLPLDASTTDVLSSDDHWFPLLQRTRCRADTEHRWTFAAGELYTTPDGTATPAQPVTFLRVHIYPDGGIMRVRVIGVPVAEKNALAPLY
jgi:allantoicase